MFGAYCIRGTRIPVRSIKRSWPTWDVARMIKEWPSLTEADVLAALAFRGTGYRGADGHE